MVDILSPLLDPVVQMGGQRKSHANTRRKPAARSSKVHILSFVKQELMSRAFTSGLLHHCSLWSDLADPAAAPAGFCYAWVTMSAINGDKARFHRERKNKLARRERSRELRKRLTVSASRRPNGRDL